MKRLSFYFIFLMFVQCVFASNCDKSHTLYFFYGNGCPHCEKEKIFLAKMQKAYPSLQVQYYEVWRSSENRAILEKFGKDFSENFSSVPVTIVNHRYFIGFTNEETTGKEIEKAIAACMKKNVPVAECKKGHHQKW